MIQPPLAGDSPALARPFKERIQGTFVDTPTSNPTLFSSVANTVGDATHAGPFTKVTSDLVNVLTGEIDGTFTMTAPDGNLLSGTDSRFVIPGAVPGTFSSLLDATITGGTGRFSTSTRSFVFVAYGECAISEGVIRGKSPRPGTGTAGTEAKPAAAPACVLYVSDVRAIS